MDGHILRGNGLMRNVLGGTVKGQKKRGRRTTKLLDDLKDRSFGNSERKALDREQ